MFGPWRKLALATTLCLPISIGQAAPAEFPLDDTRCTHRDGDRLQRDHWYRSYKRTDLEASSSPLLDDTRSYDTDYALASDAEFATLEEPSAGAAVPVTNSPVGSDRSDCRIAEEFEFDCTWPNGSWDWCGMPQDSTSGETQILENAAEFDAMPGDAFAADLPEDCVSPAPDSVGAILEGVIEHAADEPAAEEQLADDASRGLPPSPVVILSGTIEPIEPDDQEPNEPQEEQLPFESRGEGDAQSSVHTSIDSTIILDFDERAAEDGSQIDAEPAEEESPADSPVGRFHMFYPGFDWSAYAPVDVL